MQGSRRVGRRPLPSLRGCVAYLLPLATVMAIAYAATHLFDADRALRGAGDWARHIGAYFAFAAVASLAGCLVAGRARVKVLLLVLVLCAGYGVRQELRQALRAHFLEWDDLLEDVLGAVVGTAAVFLLTRRRTPRVGRR